MPSVHDLKLATALDFVRLSPDLKTAANDLGPLADLLGTWVGSLGYNMIAVPYPTAPGIPFTLLVRPYLETIEFSAIGAKVPNRQSSGIDYVTGLVYELRVSDLQTNQPMHIENGMWLDLGGPAGSESTQIARLAAIPHGDSFLALGTATQLLFRPSILPVPWQPSDPKPAYLQVYHELAKTTAPFDPTNPVKVLNDAIQHQEIDKQTVYQLTTGTGGGVLNIPFVEKNANVTKFDGTFWLEEVKQPGGAPFMQLQYVQTVMLQFAGIEFPHINVNTLVKQ